jgi:hypothetical protein
VVLLLEVVAVATVFAVLDEVIAGITTLEEEAKFAGAVVTFTTLTLPFGFGNTGTICCVPTCEIGILGAEAGVGIDGTHRLPWARDKMSDTPLSTAARRESKERSRVIRSKCATD